MQSAKSTQFHRLTSKPIDALGAATCEPRETTRLSKGTQERPESIGLSGGPNQTDLEPILDVLAEWSEQLQQADIEGILGDGDDLAVSFDDGAQTGTTPETPNDWPSGPDLEGPGL